MDTPVRRRHLIAGLVATVLAATGGLLVAPAPAQAADAAHRSLRTADNPDWMRHLPDATSLAALSLPGTHDTLAIHGGAWTQTQENHGNSAATLAVQLRAGVRAVDIRARINEGNTLTIHHGGTYQQANFDDVLNVLGSFLAARPTETVVMRLKHECTGEFGSCTDASGQLGFADVFDRYRAARPGLFWAPSVNRSAGAAVPALGAVRGKVVLAVLHGPRGGRHGQYGLAQFADWGHGSSTYVQDEYHVPNVGAIATKRDRVRRHLDATSAGDPTRMYVNFASGGSVFATPEAVAGGALGVQGVNPFLLTYLNEGSEVHPPVRRTGMLMMDFPGGGLIDRIIAVNAGRTS
ncbi:phosphatidylinositol-specific phospholipase C [Micromonospora sp. KC213]|uniref:phosphatidylinositol-specific phospholipase C n=1 Tax=Micromonospora sp. KC213 TaxID=2530378 RepID=UPI0010483DF2|nr:phosphatidylinositol-specific phospholipase C [Micromonospora sp. KC213]TDC39859.1 phosphatidylinositol-specific phospholipase C domain-containing protein [Micromonospora sp. KC213]